MSLECSECEHDLRGGHDPSCSRHPKNRCRKTQVVAEPDYSHMTRQDLVRCLRAELDNHRQANGLSLTPRGRLLLAAIRTIEADVSDTFARAFAALSKAVSDAGYHQNVRGGEIYLTRKEGEA